MNDKNLKKGGYNLKDIKLAVALNRTKPANSTNGMTFGQLMRQLKGESV